MNSQKDKRMIAYFLTVCLTLLITFFLLAGISYKNVSHLGGGIEQRTFQLVPFYKPFLKITIYYTRLDITMPYDPKSPPPTKIDKVEIDEFDFLQVFLFINVIILWIVFFRVYTNPVQRTPNETPS